MTTPQERTRAMKMLIRFAESIAKEPKVTNIRRLAAGIRKDALLALHHAPTAETFETYFEHKE